MSTRQRLSVYVQPRASRTGIAGRHGPYLKIRIASPPVDQAANEELLRFLAERLGVHRRDVRLIAGPTSRRKVIEIEGLSTERITTLLDRPEKP